MLPSVAQRGKDWDNDSSGSYFLTLAWQKKHADPHPQENHDALVALEQRFNAPAAVIFKQPEVRAAEMLKISRGILPRLAELVAENGITSLAVFQSLMDKKLADMSSSRNRFSKVNRPGTSLCLDYVRQMQTDAKSHLAAISEVQHMEEQLQRDKDETVATLQQCLNTAQADLQAAQADLESARLQAAKDMDDAENEIEALYGDLLAARSAQDNEPATTRVVLEAADAANAQLRADNAQLRAANAGLQAVNVHLEARLAVTQGRVGYHILQSNQRQGRLVQEWCRRVEVERELAEAQLALRTEQTRVMMLEEDVKAYKD